MTAPIVTYEDIRGGLADLGLGEGIALLVHSSLSSFGWVEGGAETVIKALMDLVTPEGTLMMPAFNHLRACREGKPFDPLISPTSNGRIPDTFWRMEGVCRSLNPSHSFAAWGSNAVRYTENHHLTLTVGEDSPIGMLRRDGGYQVNLGTTHGSSTAKHLAETLCNAPCLGRRREAYPVRLPSGEIAMHRTWSWRGAGCPINTKPIAIESEMNRLGLQKKGKIGNADVTCLKLDDFIRTDCELLTKGWGGFPPCSRCPVRPRDTDATIESDWDDELGRIKPAASGDGDK